MMARYGSWMLAMCLWGAGAAFAQGAGEAAHVTVEGRGAAEAQPDMATLRIGVEIEADGPGDAVAAMSDEMDGVLDALAGAGIATEDLQTGEVSLGPIYGEGPQEGGTPRISGYTATNVVSVRVRDLSRLGEVLEAGVTAGATRFDGLEFGLAMPEPVADAALAAAMSDALRKARLLAEAGDLTLGEVRAVEEIGGDGQSPMAVQTMRTDVPVAPGTLSVEARVSVTFALTE